MPPRLFPSLRHEGPLGPLFGFELRQLLQSEEPLRRIVRASRLHDDLLQHGLLCVRPHEEAQSFSQIVSWQLLVHQKSSACRTFCAQDRMFYFFSGFFGRTSALFPVLMTAFPCVSGDVSSWGTSCTLSCDFSPRKLGCFSNETHVSRSWLQEPMRVRHILTRPAIHLLLEKRDLPS